MLRILRQFLLTTLFAVFASQASAMFIQADWFDPTEPGVGTNRYAYSFNDPINRFDPTGNATEVANDELDERGEYTVDESTGDITLIDKNGYKVQVLGGTLSKKQLAKLSKCQPACDLDAILSRHTQGVHTRVDSLAGGFRTGPEIIDDRGGFAKGTDALMSIPGVGTLAFGARQLTKTLARGRGICSFHIDTLVLTRGGLVPIGLIEPGTLVWSRDPDTGMMAWKPVLDAYSNFYPDRVKVSVFDKETRARQTIISNRIHPFFAQTSAFYGKVAEPFGSKSSEGHVYKGPIPNGFWIDAASLKPGYLLLNADQSWSEVVAVEILPNPLNAFNLMIEDFHTYFVTARSNGKPVWVHNNCFDFDTFQVIHQGMNLRKFDGVSTQDIVNSLLRGPEPLLVSRDGRIFKGNARMQELMNRGYDMDKIRGQLSGANFHETRNPFIPPGLE